MIRVAAVLGLLGLAAATAIIVWNGYQPILAALERSGWGFVWISLYHVVSMVCCVIGWRAVMPGRRRPSHVFLLYILWLRSSVNNMMPVARIGGEAVAVRVMIKHGIRRSTAIASTVVELTTSVVAIFIFSVAGIALFAFRVSDNDMGWRLATAVLLSAPPIAALIVVQRIGFFGLLDRVFRLMARDGWRGFFGNLAQLDRAVHAIYRRRLRVLYCGFWQLMSWTAGIGEIWLALYFLGHPLPLLECFMIEALIQASANAAFVVPGALGVQEAGFLVFGQMLGLTSDVAIAMAVIRRCRDLLVFIPGLVAWQVQEGRWLLRPRTT